MSRKKLLTITWLLALLFACAYLLCSLFNGSFDIADWSGSTREALAGILPSFILMIVGLTILSDELR